MLNEKKPKLRISPKKYNGDTSVISTRIPKKMLKDIDAVSGTTGRTRNEIMLMCLEYALNNMEITND